MRFLILLLLIAPLKGFAQKIPADIRIAPAVLTITCEADQFEERKKAVLAEFEKLDLSVTNTFHFHENPTQRAKDGTAIKNQILAEKATYIYSIQVLIVGGDYNLVLLILDAENFDSPQAKVRYKTLGDTFEKLFKNFAKDLKKL